MEIPRLRPANAMAGFACSANHDRTSRDPAKIIQAFASVLRTNRVTWAKSMFISCRVLDPKLAICPIFAHISKSSDQARGGGHRNRLAMRCGRRGFLDEGE